MKLNRQNVILKIFLFINFVFGISNVIFSQANIGAPPSKFLILVETTKDGLKLSGVKGCAWTELTFTLKQGGQQAIDKYGMTSLYKDEPTEGKHHLSDFLFVIKKTKHGISLEGKRGTVWTNLNFNYPQRECHQYIDSNGMVSSKI